MALYRIDGFDDLPATGAADSYLIADGWFNTIPAGGSTTFTTATGRFNKGLALVISGGNYGTASGSGIGKRYTTETCVIGQSVVIPLSGYGSGITINDAQGGRGQMVTVEFDDLGVIRLYRGSLGVNGGTLIAVTPAKTYHINQGDFVEIKCKIHATTGLVEVRINTVVVLSYTGNTLVGTPDLSLAPGWDSLVYNISRNTSMQIDDRYILDDTGTNNLTYIGNARVNTQFVQAAGDLTQFAVTGAATNWQAVLAGKIDDTQYVSAPTSGNTDLYTANPNVSAQAIFGVQVKGLYRQDDSTQMTAANLLKTGGVIYAGASRALSANYTYYRDLWELNPGTTAAWTATILNLVQPGTKVV